jgi:hypothetical protein
MLNRLAASPNLSPQATTAARNFARSAAASVRLGQKAIDYQQPHPDPETERSQARDIAYYVKASIALGEKALANERPLPNSEDARRVKLYRVFGLPLPAWPSRAWFALSRPRRMQRCVHIIT